MNWLLGTGIILAFGTWVWLQLRDKHKGDRMGPGWLERDAKERSTDPDSKERW